MESSKPQMLNLQLNPGYHTSTPIRGTPETPSFGELSDIEQMEPYYRLPISTSGLVPIIQGLLNFAATRSYNPNTQSSYRAQLAFVTMTAAQITKKLWEFRDSRVDHIFGDSGVDYIDDIDYIVSAVDYTVSPIAQYLGNIGVNDVHGVRLIPTSWNESPDEMNFDIPCLKRTASLEGPQASCFTKLQGYDHRLRKWSQMDFSDLPHGQELINLYREFIWRLGLANIPSESHNLDGYTSSEIITFSNSSALLPTEYHRLHSYELNLRWAPVEVNDMAVFSSSAFGYGILPSNGNDYFPDNPWRRRQLNSPSDIVRTYEQTPDTDIDRILRHYRLLRSEAVTIQT